MKSLPTILALTMLSLSTSAAMAQTKYDSGLIPNPVILLPDATATSLVVLLSDSAGWGTVEQKEAERLQGNGSIVIGIDTPAYLTALSKDDGDCIYMISDIEDLAHQTERNSGNTAYLPPIVAGIGGGGALALAMLAQTPQATMGQTLAIDPKAGIPLKQQLCTPAEKSASGDGMIYGLTDGALPDPATVVFSPVATADGRKHVESLLAKHPDIDIRETNDTAAVALPGLLDEFIAAGNVAQPLGMPLDVLEVSAPTHDTMAVVYSGDGGWRDLDRQVAGFLQQQGIPVVGVDSLKYFWSAKTPQQTADDLAKIIRVYEKRWNVHHILLVGYSFGADVLPATYNRLPDHLRAKVAQISLMALSHQVDYEISVTGWLGATGDGAGGDPVTDIKLIDANLIQCFYGSDEEEDACRDLKALHIDTTEIDGGHHFDGDYEKLTASIVAGLVKRLGG